MALPSVPEENVYDEPLTTNLRPPSVSNLSLVSPPRSVHSARSRGSSNRSSNRSASTAHSHALSSRSHGGGHSGKKISYKKTETSMGIFRKRKTVIDCGAYTDMGNG